MGSVLPFLLISVLVLTFKSSQQQSQCVGKLDIVFVIDGSNSMGKTNFEFQISSIKNLIQTLAVSDQEIHAGLVVFSSVVDNNIALTGDKAFLVSLNIEYPDDTTRTDLGIDAAMSNFAANARNGDVPKLMMIITDGQSDNPTLSAEAADRAKNADINIFAVGVTISVDRAELERLASAPDQVIVTNDFTQLEQTLIEATNTACVNLECSDAPIDLAFVLDSSVDANTFTAFKDWVKTFVAFANVDDGNVKVSIVTYSDSAQLWFGLNDVTTKEELYSGIDHIAYTPGNSNPASALALLRDAVFRHGNGDRQSAPDVTIFVTGSLANVNAAAVSTEAQETRAVGVQIYTVGVGLPNIAELSTISSLPLNEHTYPVADTSALDSVIQPIFNSFNKFCKDASPVPACAMGQRDVWLVVDLSSTADRLSLETTARDFGYLKTGLNGLMDVVTDPSVPNPDLRFGMIGYSDSAATLVDVEQVNSVQLTDNAVASLPGGIQQGSTRLDLALQSIVLPPANSTNNNYVLIVTAENVPEIYAPTVVAEAQRISDMGFTLVIVVVTDDGQWSVSDFPIASERAGLTQEIGQYSELQTVTRAFTRDYMCLNSDISDYTSLCADSGHIENGVSTIPHPTDCDKFIQCYYNPNGLNGPMDLAVIRHCSMGHFYSAEKKTCVLVEEANCPYDPCENGCEPYKMEGSCRAYWECSNDMSVHKCCPHLFAYVPGLGCQLDFSCTQYCGKEHSECVNMGYCKKRPDWDEPAAYDISLGALNMWMTRPCLHTDFDIVHCSCSAPRDHSCPADREYDFKNASVLLNLDDPKCKGLTVMGVKSSSNGATFSKDSHLNVPVEPMYDAEDPFMLKMRFSESDSFNTYGAVLLSSGYNCSKGGGSLLISAGQGYIEAQIKSHNGRTVTVKVPTEGIPRNSFKDLTLTYGNHFLALSVRGQNQQYISQVEAPSGICFRCGLDIGGGSSKFHFEGVVESLSVHSCLPAKLY